MASIEDKSIWLDLLEKQAAKDRQREARQEND